MAIDAGLDRASNGNLTTAAEELEFDAFVTPDRNIAYQQNLTGRKLAPIILPSGRWPGVQDQLDDVIAAIDDALP